MEMELTVFTPTYNRAYVLEECYHSLCAQTNQNFIWLIVDDGSNDNTGNLVQQWILQNKITIQYIYQNNLGKQRAINTAINNCQTKYIADLDSDDKYLPDTVATILEYMEKIKSDTQIAGIIGRRLNSNGQILGSKIIPKGSFVTNIDKLIKGYKYMGDTNRAYKTEILAKFLYPEIDDKFIPEDYMWAQIDQKFGIYFVNQAFAISDYLDDGYTKNIYSLYKKNPYGVYLAFNQLLLSKRGLKYNIISTVNYSAWIWKFKIRNSFSNCKNKKRFLFCLPISILCYIFKFPKWIFSAEEI